MYVCITTDQPDTKSNPNSNPATKCQTPPKRRTDEETRRVSLSVVSITGVHPMAE